MRILVGKTFGIGNAVLGIPLIKALFSRGTVDVLVGSGPDDFGAREVYQTLLETWPSPGRYVNRIHVDRVPDSEEPYDVAIMAIPFDGRWVNGIHFRADEVLDGRKRPGNVERLGLDMWLKHEVEYQVENARELGFDSPIPDMSFLPRQVQETDLVYLGIGFKRDPGGYGAGKHIGNDNYVRLLRSILELRPDTRFISTGNLRDTMEVGTKIMRELGGAPTYVCHTKPLGESFRLLAGCHAYIGNDTGMMHVAASIGMPTFGLMAYPGSEVKNPPWCPRSWAEPLWQGRTPEQIAADFVGFAW